MAAVGQPLHVKCPVCARVVPWTPEQIFKPFCSERCKLIDLGDWATESNRIPGEPLAQIDDFDEEDQSLNALIDAMPCAPAKRAVDNNGNDMPPSA